MQLSSLIFFSEWSYNSAAEGLRFIDISVKQQSMNLVNCFVSYL